jgi:hypothetical protein
MVDAIYLLKKNYRLNLKLTTMKQLLILLVVCLSFVGCSPDRETVKSTITNKIVNGYVLQEFTYEGCQYLASGQGITHKGNCNNPIHK